MYKRMTPADVVAELPRSPMKGLTASAGVFAY
jgi:hypothetical protein